MRNYDKMSDFEINKLVAAYDAGGRRFLQYLDSKSDVACYTSSGIHIATKNYCENPSDAWPVIIGSGISILSPCNTCDKWLAGSNREEIPYEGDFYPTMHEDANPLRAAMIVFLMMQESKDA